ncbi:MULTISPECIES: hypothetical protein [Streptomyces]|uniref:Uncharacterized protein n=1 Tax=Streptomyces fradiae ATCC 10745 = DSM 40063 TaxID=1319510 RepID=A0A1Y2NT47_STRFR|nr:MULTISPECIES: hypothetical protein [Streptomyces]KAF0647214.1 hypothetical protein K701_24995 [Streptomyces fradiae ATCC 10745 = DSM 40063]OSY50646.1 hypothetical protein BG846_03716 [Streptomyces fradiae ATCC 10745 = DSM 40063]QEV15176.1 hypothetical protein CP974_28030 [Streptomyces fradiae ATCC 10745 = DSM 40063]UQS30016.1 hypothetical protein J5J01_24630 [Streptomyces fradiae]
MDTTLWLLVACASACSLVTAFGTSLRIGMSRLDAAELRRRRHMDRVLEANAQLAVDRHTASAPPPPPREPGDAGRHPSAPARLRGRLLRACRLVYVRFGG